jgi:hypothetical protein
MSKKSGMRITSSAEIPAQPRFADAVQALPRLELTTVPELHLLLIRAAALGALVRTAIQPDAVHPILALQYAQADNQLRQFLRR